MIKIVDPFWLPFSMYHSQIIRCVNYRIRIDIWLTVINWRRIIDFLLRKLIISSIENGTRINLLRILIIWVTISLVRWKISLCIICRTQGIFYSLQRCQNLSWNMRIWWMIWIKWGLLILLFMDFIVTKWKYPFGLIEMNWRV